MTWLLTKIARLGKRKWCRTLLESESRAHSILRLVARLHSALLLLSTNSPTKNKFLGSG